MVKNLNFGAMKKRDELELAVAQMLHPDRGIHKHQRLARGARGRRRRIFRRRGSLPPRAASLLALSRATRASSPAWTTAVFSVIPLSCAACLSRSSLMFRVVCLCISIHDSCIRLQEDKEKGSVLNSVLQVIKTLPRSEKASEMNRVVQ